MDYTISKQIITHLTTVQIKVEPNDNIEENRTDPIEAVQIKCEPVWETADTTNIHEEKRLVDVNSSKSNTVLNNEPVDTNVTIKTEPLTNDDSSFRSEVESQIQPEFKRVVEESTQAVTYCSQIPTLKQVKIEVEIEPTVPLDGHSSSSNEIKATDRRKIHGNGSKIHSKFKNIKMVQAPKRTYACDQCDMAFIKKDRLTKHLVVHLGLKYSCDICQKQFSSKHNMLRHKHVHTGFKPFSCDHCGKSFMEKSYLAAHLRTHFADKIYKCSVCTKEFRERTHLIRHERIHSGERPYSCEVCHKQFKQSAHLSCHRKIHKKKEVLYCDVCKEGFLEKEDLYEHHKVHIGEKAYSCEVCHRQFSQTSHLNDHLRVHNGIRPFRCHMCDKSFSQRSTLNRHIRNHSSEKPYPCPVCQKKFKQKTHVTKHVKLHERGGSLRIHSPTSPPLTCSDDLKQNFNGERPKITGTKIPSNKRDFDSNIKSRENDNCDPVKEKLKSRP